MLTETDYHNATVSLITAIEADRHPLTGLIPQRRSVSLMRGDLVDAARHYADIGELDEHTEDLRRAHAAIDAVQAERDALANLGV